MIVDLTCDRGASCCNEPRERMPQDSGKRDNRRIAEEIAQEGLDRGRRIRSPKIEQHDSEFHAEPLTRATSRATCCGGVSGNTPWPRLKMKGTFLVSSRMRSMASSKALPPGISAIGSRLPWSATCLPRAPAAQAIDVAVSILTASTPVSDA